MSDGVRRFAALLCSHCQTTGFTEAAEIATDVLVDIEYPLDVRCVIAEALNVREHPGVDDDGHPIGKHLASIVFGQTVDVWCDRDDGWSCVTWEEDGGGWCSSQYLGPVSLIE